MNTSYLLYLVVAALLVWLILKLVGVAISSTVFWVVLIVLILLALVSGGRGRWF